MTQSVSVFLVVLVALLAANFPFVTTRLMGFFALNGGKSLALRLLELLLLYGVVGLLGAALEQHAGQVAPQGWEFFAITFALFLTFAFPGFIYRYLLKRDA
jgi:hypothetical protein